MQGVPDCMYVVDGVAGWLELKFVAKRPARADTVPVDLRPNQRAELEAIRARRGNAHVLLGIGRDDVYLLDPAHVEPVPGKPGRVPLWKLPEAGSVGGIWHGRLVDLAACLAARGRFPPPRDT